MLNGTRVLWRACTLEELFDMSSPHRALQGDRNDTIISIFASRIVGGRLGRFSGHAAPPLYWFLVQNPPARPAIRLIVIPGSSIWFINSTGPRFCTEIYTK